MIETLDDAAILHVAAYFRALSEPTRLRALNLLRSGECNVGELALSLGTTTANISKHLTMLAKNGFVIREARGTAVFYRIADPAIFDLCDLVCGQLARHIAAQAESTAKLTINQA